MTNIFHSSASLRLESGKVLDHFHLAYTVHGNLNDSADNVVWIFHALTANSDPQEWWHGLVGKEKLIDPDRYFIVCVNMPGSCYGSIGPLDTNEKSSSLSYHDFPMFTTRDMIMAYRQLKDFLGIKRIHIGMGGSMGGQQLLEWAVEEPHLFEHIIPIATNARHSPWGIAFNATQRACIENDPSWVERNERAGIEGMKTARAVALISYRNYITYQKNQDGRQSDEEPIDRTIFKAESYQRYQGEKLARRFNAFSYHVLSKSMDAHDIGRGREDTRDVLKRIKAKTLVIGLHSDILFPVTEQEFLAKHIPGARLELIDSLYGHDGFLLEFEQIESRIRNFMDVTIAVEVLRR